MVLQSPDGFPDALPRAGVCCLRWLHWYFWAVRAGVPWSAISLNDAPTIDMGLYRFVAETGTADDVYLIPTGMAEFRLETGAPVLVTFKSHPYKDTEVIEWQTRVETANGFYGEPTCGRLLEVVDRYAITHVVLGALVSCPMAVWNWNHSMPTTRSACPR